MRLDLRPRLRTSVRSAVRYFGAFTLVPLLGMAAGGVVAHFVNAVEEKWLFLNSIVFVVVFSPVIWMLCFVGFSAGPAIRSFNTAGVHPALPALLTGVLVWESAALGLAMAGLPPGPPLVQICALVGGPVSVTALSWWEIHRLRTRHGVVLRGEAS
ncbi:hypothetical protein [Streptomyces sp. NPDC048349]|uniref:hypothetical protein n=1 Tax=Streptomyces sp. NPDC048349 TaxID=3155486 RepID=UPI00343FE2F1